MWYLSQRIEVWSDGMDENNTFKWMKNKQFVKKGICVKSRFLVGEKGHLKDGSVG